MQYYTGKVASYLKSFPRLVSHFHMKQITHSNELYMLGYSCPADQWTGFTKVKFIFVSDWWVRVHLLVCSFVYSSFKRLCLFRSIQVVRDVVKL